MKSPSSFPSLLIAESGATKTEWRYRQEGKEWINFQSVGLNPSTFSEKDLIQTLEGIFSQSPISSPPETLYFFGAGLRHAATQVQFKRALEGVLPGIRSIYLQDDLQAAVWACERTSGIVAILGTGSNACTFEKGTILERIGGLGYLLGDEGSGMDLGRSLIQALLREELPTSLQKRILIHLQTDTKDLRNQVYEASKPALFFAGLAPTLKHFETEPPIQQLLQKRFEYFIQTHLLPLPQIRKLPIDFVGSIAYHFHASLSESMRKQGLQIGKLIRYPIDILSQILNSQKKL